MKQEMKRLSCSSPSYSVCLLFRLAISCAESPVDAPHEQLCYLHTQTGSSACHCTIPCGTLALLVRLVCTDMVSSVAPFLYALCPNSNAFSASCLIIFCELCNAICIAITLYYQEKMILGNIRPCAFVFPCNLLTAA